ncbi:MAG TPA: hypothetical protein VKM37_09130 [Balneolaceae bacterium]|nr:hypothetical protein [Balneolaceae bacterium]
MTANREIIVRQATPEDEPALRQFYQAAYDSGRYPYKYPLRWNWLYRKNPFIPNGFGLPIWVAFHKEMIVGHTGAMFVPCKIIENRLTAAWSVDTVVLPAYRKTGLGKRLQKANQDAHSVFISLSMSAANRAIKQKLGAVAGPAARLYVYTHRIDPACLFKGVRLELQNRLGHLWGKKAWQVLWATGFPRVFSKYIEARLHLRQKKQISSMQGPPLDFIPVTDRFGQQAGQLWTACRDDYNFSVERTRTYLNWKYVDQPHICYERFYAYSKDRLAGLIVFRCCRPPEPGLGVISDLLCARGFENCAPRMLGFALEKLHQQNVAGIYMATASPDIENILQQYGFLYFSNEVMCLFDRSQTAGTSNHAWRALLAKGDHDWDQYPLTRQMSVSEIRKTLKGRKADIS